VWVRALFWVTYAVAGSLVLRGNSVVGSLTQNERQQSLLLGSVKRRELCVCVRDLFWVTYAVAGEGILFFVSSPRMSGSSPFCLELFTKC